VTGSRAGAERAAHLALIVGLAGHPGVAWLTPYGSLVASENKLRQDAYARRLGVAVPGTAVASDPDGIPPEFGDDLVIKPLGPGHFTADGGEARVVWAERMRRSDARLNALRGAPFLVQPRIDAARHLRVVTCGERAWSCELDARDLPLDWRRDERAHHAFLPADEPEAERDALRLAAAFGVRYSSQDWIVAGGRSIFIDLNPAGQWLFLPEAVSGSITQAIADHLAA
jgi:glutathione synthase/RimK-type ligase-like ATP-grasp enzyme